MAEERFYEQILEKLRTIERDAKERGERTAEALGALNQKVTKLTGVAGDTKTRCQENKTSIESLEETVQQHGLTLVRITTVSGFQQKDLNWVRDKIWYLLGLFTAGIAIGATVTSLLSK